MFPRTFPILTTTDLTRALDFYIGLLGGKISYQFPAEGDPVYAGVDLGSSHLGIGYDPEAGAATEPQRISLWVYADDCDQAVEHLRAAGVTIDEEPADQRWGERVARVRDPDGNILIIGSGPAA